MTKRKPYQDTSALFKERGYKVWKATWWNPFAKCSQDLGGLFDLMAFKKGEPMIGIQATSDGNRATHRKKMQAHPDLADFIGSGCRALLVTWGNTNGERGRKKTCYEEFIE